MRNLIGTSIRATSIRTLTSLKKSPALILIALVTSCAAPTPARMTATGTFDRDHAMAAIQSPTRTDADRKADSGRKPLELLEFARIGPGMTVLDISAGGGYTSELLALDVTPGGAVWAQLEEPSKNLAKRLAEHPQENLHVTVRAYDNIFDDELPRVDRATLILSYHDIAYEPVDRAAMDVSIYKALRQGGYLTVIDHAAEAGSGVRDTKTLHRIDEAVVIKEFEKAGFVLDGHSDAWRNPADPRTQAFFNMSIPADEFALRFVKI